MSVSLTMQKFCIYITLVLIYIAKAQDPETQVEFILNDDKVRYLSSINYPNPYPPETQNFILKANEGYSILVTIKNLDLDGENGDYLIIKPGDTLHGEGKGKVFTYILKSERKYLLHSKTAYVRFEVNGKNENGKKGFSLIFQRVGEELTTSTEIPTTVVTWPTPSGSDSIYYTAYISGKRQEDFNNPKILSNLKTAISEMAIQYCNENNFLLSDNITQQNVQIHYLIQCTYSWPNSNTCVKLRFALPILLQQNSSQTGYQLTTAHLEQMWIRLASYYLQKYDMDVYSEPDNNSSFRMWIIIICIILLLFLILLYLVKMIFKKKGKRRNSDTSNIISHEARASKASLGPHPYQTTPSFFENDYSFDQFEPDVGVPSKAYKSSMGHDYSYPLSEDDSDNDIIFSNFSNSRNNTESINKESNS